MVATFCTATDVEGVREVADVESLKEYVQTFLGKAETGPDRQGSARSDDQVAER